MDTVNNDAIRQECQKKEMEYSGELEEECGVCQTTMSVCVFHVLLELTWNIKMAFNF